MMYQTVKNLYRIYIFSILKKFFMESVVISPTSTSIC